MRRIPRPLRAIDPAASRHASHAHHAQHFVAPTTNIRTATSSFSTTPTRAFLLPAKPNKKKHQQWVRKWQKRLLGDSEPIGAHVDPFDPTSPVRISPEEQGEYEEVLDGDGLQKHGLRSSEWYEPASHGKKLMHVGGEAWQQQKLEVQRAREFEKLTLRTYTPMTLNMANEIESLTNTPYTLRDDNLYMAQTVHEVSGRPYTKYNFGLHKRPAKVEHLRGRFVQAVAEIYTLKNGGLNLDLAKSPNQGIYDVPSWVQDIKLHSTESGELIVTLPEHVNAEEFIRVMQAAPEDMDLAQRGVEEDLIVEEGAEAIEHLPTMDPATPAFKRAAVVKADPDKKPFDFMSNRPVPRAKPAEPVQAEKVEAVEAQQPIVEPTPSASARLAELVTKSEASQSAVSELQRTILEHRAQRIADDVAAMQKSTNFMPVPRADVKWHCVPIADDALKFALFKRLYQLTGYRISDPHLSSSKTLGDLYDHLFNAAKPKPKSLHSALHIEGHKARQRAKNSSTSEESSRNKADLGDLLVLGNVELRRSKPVRSELARKTGMHKVINYALQERGLPTTPERRHKQLPDLQGVVEGTGKVQNFGKPLSSKAANYMTERLKERRAAEAERELQSR